MKCDQIHPLIIDFIYDEISEENKKLISENNIELKGRLNQFFHKVYHCNDTGEFSNKFIDLF